MVGITGSSKDAGLFQQRNIAMRQDNAQPLLQDNVLFRNGKHAAVRYGGLLRELSELVAIYFSGSRSGFVMGENRDAGRRLFWGEKNRLWAKKLSGVFLKNPLAAKYRRDGYGLQGRSHRKKGCAADGEEAVLSSWLGQYMEDVIFMAGAFVDF